MYTTITKHFDFIIILCICAVAVSVAVMQSETNSLSISSSSSSSSSSNNSNVKKKGHYDRTLNLKGKYKKDKTGWYFHDGQGYYVHDNRGIYRPDGTGFYTFNGTGKYTWNGTDFINVDERTGGNSKSRSLPFNLHIPNVDYKFDILTKDGIRIQQIGGYVKTGENKEVLRVRGSFAYNSPENKTNVVDYIVDDNDFRVVGTRVLKPQFLNNFTVPEQ